MRSGRQDGAITVFLSIILLIMITLAGVIVDVARINTAKSQIKRALESSISSTLAGYQTSLREKYGVFALNENNGENLEKIIRSYLSKNLMIEKGYLDESKIGNYVDLYNYNIENIEVNPMFNLAQDTVTRHQICEFMKYRAPKEFAQDFLEKLNALKKAGPTAEVCKRKIEFEKELKKIESIQREIYKNVYGEYEKRILFFWRRQTKLGNYVRKLNEEECEALVDEYIENVDRYIRLKKKLNDIDDPKKKKRIKRKIRKAKNKMQQQYNNLVNQIEEYAKINSNALDNIDKLIEKSKSVSNKLNQYERYLSKNTDNIIEASKKEFIKEIKKYDKLIPNKQKEKSILNDMEEKIDKNIKLLEKRGMNGSSVLGLIKKIDPKKAKTNIEYIKSVKKDIINEIRVYNNKIEYDYNLVKNRKSEYKKYDLRKNNQEKANKKIKLNPKEKNGKQILISDKEYSILPSVLKEEASNEYKNINFLWNKNDYNETGREATKGIEFHEDEKLGFSESALSYLTDITKKIDLKNIRDEIYINEYIMGTFKNYVSDIDEEFNLRNLKKEDQDTYFKKSEVEYILNGKRNEKINQTLTDSKLLLIRFGLNSIHTFTCEKKKKVATATATAVAGWYTGGAGIPIIRTLILLGWAMGESVYDLDELKAGREVALYKTEDDWKTDLKAGSEEFKNKDINNEDKKPSLNKKDFINTSYQDYLRFLLLIQDESITINRIQDLIQLNIQKQVGNDDYKLNESNTYIKVEVIASIKYLFLTQNFIPEDIKSLKNRHKFKTVIYQGY